MSTNPWQGKSYISDNFTLMEFCKSDVALRRGIKNDPNDDTTIGNIRLVAKYILEPVRAHYGIPFSPNSGYRSKKLNKALPGSKKSQHCKGEAVDFEIPGISNYDLALWCSANLDFDQLILELYEPGVPSSGWVHASYIEIGNRKQVLTYTADRKYVQGLVV